MQAGEEISNPVAWKKGQKLTNSITIILTALFAIIHFKFPDFSVTDDQLLQITSVIGSILILINGFIITATDKEKGVKK